MSKYKGQIALLIASVIWGSSFMFQKMGMDFMGPFTFGFYRFILGSLALLPVIWIYSRYKKRKPVEERTEITSWNDRTLIIGSVLCGVGGFVAASLQQIGIVYTTAGKAGFITSMDIVIVPIFMMLLRQKVSRITWLSVAVALIGLWMLCITEGFNIAVGDAFVLGCAIAYSFQIMFIDYYSERVDVLKLSFMQFFLTGILSLIAALCTETIELQALIDCIGPVLYVAILEVSIAFTLQVVGQKYTSAASAALIMSLESVFAVICGVLFLNETMSVRELAGCAIMFTAFIIAQIPDILSGRKSG